MKANHMIIKGKWIVTLERLYMNQYIKHANLQKLGMQALIKSGIVIPINQEANDPYCTLILTTDGKRVLDHFFDRNQIIQNKRYKHKNVWMTIVLLMLGILFLIVNHLLEPVIVGFPIAPQSYTYHHFTYTKMQIRAIKHMQNSIPYIRQQFENPMSIWFNALNLCECIIAILFVILLFVFIFKGAKHQYKIDIYNYHVSLAMTINNLRDLIDKDIQLNWDADFISMYDEDIRNCQVPAYTEPHPNERFSYYLALY